jgi:L-2-hydroxyglutarate oxidase
VTGPAILADSPRIIVAGAGIVGLSTALKLSSLCRVRVTVVEAEKDVATHQTGRNSGVIHSGLYYKPGSLKAVLCRDGRRQLVEFCQANEVAHDICGKIVLATTPEERLALPMLEEKGRANELTGIRRIPSEAIPEYEPHARGLEALLVPETGIVDYRAVASAMVRQIVAMGGEVFPTARLRNLRRTPAGIVCKTSAGDFEGSFLINCCGLQSDRVARACGANPAVTIVPFRGEYYDIVPARRSLVRNLIYPVPDPRYPFLGVHFTRRIDGSVEAGPNAVFSFAREGYSRTSVSVRDTFESVLAPGFWTFAGANWRAGLNEFRRSFSKWQFTSALQKLVPEITGKDIVRGGCGVRAQALDPLGRLVDDFTIVPAERSIHVLNAPSPAATASLAIAEAITGLAAREFDLGIWPGVEKSASFTALK